METLIAEDLLLLLLDDEKGTTPAMWVDVRVPLGAAVLAELALRGAVVVEPATSRWRTPKVAVTEVPVDDDVLATARALIAEKPRTAADLAGRVGDGLEDRLAERLAGRGLLERHDDRVLGLFPRTRWPATASTHEAAVRDRLAAVVVAGAAPDERSVALAGILGALDRLAPVLDLRGAGARDAKRRVAALAESDWAAAAVREAVQAAVTAVTTTAVIATTTVATTS
ncbi:GOLPH3/VPS74 family protein [Amnibacterium setariae]|uniref:GPP34 family phosphoprotein n=1 Tax=Amnibacterium setariae TaxID=2306585 RepID=A0A3A1U172_9MICO|nr:GPP34 family phosphoprotein [Amnibacterium setariae]RIX28685.1 GPP34 family phosphoprotein [Amnibacterium setariae]